MTSLPNSTNRTPPIGDQIPPSCIADVFTKSREVLLQVIMDLRTEKRELTTLFQNELERTALLKEKLKKIHNESRV